MIEVIVNLNDPIEDRGDGSSTIRSLKSLFFWTIFAAHELAAGSLRQVSLLARRSGGHAMLRNPARSDLPNLVVVIGSVGTLYPCNHKPFATSARIRWSPLAHSQAVFRPGALACSGPWSRA